VVELPHVFHQEQARMELELYIRLWPDFFILAQGEQVVSEVERLLRSAGGEPEPNTVLATVLFTDIVGSTAKAAELGDPRWAQWSSAATHSFAVASP
jgi:hypothetical protein